MVGANFNDKQTLKYHKDKKQIIIETDRQRDKK